MPFLSNYKTNEQRNFFQIYEKLFLSLITLTLDESAGVLVRNTNKNELIFDFKFDIYSL